MFTTNPFGLRRLPDLALSITLDSGVQIVALPHPGTRAQGAITKACGGFDLWFQDANGSLDSMTGMSSTLDLRAADVLAVFNMLRACPVDLLTVRDTRAFLKAAAKDVLRYGTRLSPAHVPVKYAGLGAA